MPKFLHVEIPTPSTYEYQNIPNPLSEFDTGHRSFSRLEDYLYDLFFDPELEIVDFKTFSSLKRLTLTFQDEVFSPHGHNRLDPFIDAFTNGSFRLEQLSLALPVAFPLGLNTPYDDLIVAIAETQTGLVKVQFTSSVNERGYFYRQYMLSCWPQRLTTAVLGKVFGLPKMEQLCLELP